MKTLTDINNKLDSLDIDKENIRQAIISQSVSVDISESISTYGDYIRMINPDIRLNYIYAQAYQNGDSLDPADDIVWDSSNMLMDLGMKMSDFTDNSLVIKTGIKTSSIVYNDPPTRPWNSPKYCPIFTTKPYISQYYPDYYLNYFNLEARITSSPAFAADHTEYLLYTFPSVNPRTYPNMYNPNNAPNISKIDPSNSILMPYRVASPEYLDDELEITLKTNSIKADFNNVYHDTEHVQSVSRATPVSSTIGDSLTAYNPNNMDTIKLDLGPGFILKNYSPSSRKVRGGRSQKFYYIIVKDANNREIKKIVPFLRYNPSTKVYDTIILKDIHNENDNGIVVPYPYLYRNGQWEQMTQGKTYYDPVLGQHIVYFKFYYK